MTKRKASYHDEPPVIERPAACPMCGSIRRSVRSTISLPKHPLKVDETTYPGRILRKVTCDDCGKRYRTSSPFGDPRDPERARLSLKIDHLSGQLPAASADLAAAQSRIDDLNQAVEAAKAELDSLQNQAIEAAKAEIDSLQ